MDGIRTLCTRCAGYYRVAGFSVASCGYQEVKKSCNLCGKPGFDYVVKEKTVLKKGTG